MESLYSRHPRGILKCSDLREVKFYYTSCYLGHIQVSLLQRCPHFRRLEYIGCMQTGVSSFQGIGIEGIPLYLDKCLSSLQGVRKEGFH